MRRFYNTPLETFEVREVYINLPKYRVAQTCCSNRTLLQVKSEDVTYVFGADRSEEFARQLGTESSVVISRTEYLQALALAKELAYTMPNGIFLEEKDLEILGVNLYLTQAYLYAYTSRDTSLLGSLKKEAETFGLTVDERGIRYEYL